MEERKTFFDHIGRIFCIFGITMLIMMILCLLFGDGAKEISSMFRLGSQGLALETMLQYLGVAAAIELIRTFFMTDRVLKRMSMAHRCAGLLLTIILLIAVFIVIFDWFPTDSPAAWGMFFLCFGISFGISFLVTLLREKQENRRMADGLERLKREWQEGGKK